MSFGLEFFIYFSKIWLIYVVALLSPINFFAHFLSILNFIAAKEIHFPFSGIMECVCVLKNDLENLKQVNLIVSLNTKKKSVHAIAKIVHTVNEANEIKTENRGVFTSETCSISQRWIYSIGFLLFQRFAWCSIANALAKSKRKAAFCIAAAAAVVVVVISVFSPVSLFFSWLL